MKLQCGTGARLPSPSTIFSQAAGKPEGMQEGKLTIYLLERRLGDFLDRVCLPHDGDKLAHLEITGCLS